MCVCVCQSLSLSKPFWGEQIHTRCCAIQGFKHIETDCQLSKDGIPVVIHSEMLEKTTNGAGALTCLGPYMAAHTQYVQHWCVISISGPWPVLHHLMLQMPVL